MVTIRSANATIDDATIVDEFVHKLGVYQKMESAIKSTPETILSLLESNDGHALIAEMDGKPVACLYYTFRSSAFIARKVLYIDVFYIDDEARHHGTGKKMMSRAARIALEHSCARMEWGCLDWNEPTIRFYNTYDPHAMDDMTIYRLNIDQMREIAD